MKHSVEFSILALLELIERHGNHTLSLLPQ